MSKKAFSRALSTKSAVPDELTSRRHASPTTVSLHNNQANGYGELAPLTYYKTEIIDITEEIYDIPT